MNSNRNPTIKLLSFRNSAHLDSVPQSLIRAHRINRVILGRMEEEALQGCCKIDNGGGGGSRTHVRGSCRKGIYKLSRLTFTASCPESTPSDRQPPRASPRFSLTTRATWIGEPARSTPGSEIAGKSPADGLRQAVKLRQPLRSCCPQINAVYDD